MCASPKAAVSEPVQGLTLTQVHLVRLGHKQDCGCLTLPRYLRNPARKSRARVRELAVPAAAVRSRDVTALQARTREERVLFSTREQGETETGVNPFLKTV